MVIRASRTGPPSGPATPPGRRRGLLQNAARPAGADAPDPSWKEACAALHAELDRLPDTLRLPLLLCYLDGLSRDEAARRLGWSLNAVRGRLERGRVRLRKRLEKRGISLSAGLLGAVAVDAVPPALVRGTLATARAAGPGSSRALAAGLWKAGLAAGLATAVVAGLVLRPDTAPGQPGPAKPKAVAELPKKAEPEAPKTVTVSGVVVGTNGSGVCTAKVIIRRQDQTDADGVTAVTDPGGRFQATVPEIAGETAMVAVSTRREGIAGGWQTWTGPPPKELRLVEVKDDVPVQGRVLDLEGKPVAGVTVTVQAVHVLPDGGPQAFVDWLTGTRPRPAQNVLHGVPPGATATAVTGADGKFKLTGIGRDRVVQLLVTGPAIAHEHIYVATVAKLADPGGRRREQDFRGDVRLPGKPGPADPRDRPRRRHRKAGRRLPGERVWRGGDGDD